jgi:hypothetical protein
MGMRLVSIFVTGCKALGVALVDAGVGCIILGVGGAACPADYKGVASMQHHFPGSVE